MRIAVVPARGGSKRLARKNVKPLLGRSLVWRTVTNAIAAGVFDRVIVSTEDEEIAAEGRRAGAEVPFMRPLHLATDTAGSFDVLLHAAEQVIPVAERANSIVGLLQPTSPFLTADHVVAAFSVFSSGKFSSLSSMQKVHQYPEWMFESKDGGRVAPVNSIDFFKSSHEMPVRFVENGAIYLVRGETLFEKLAMYDFANHGIFEMSMLDSLDIDTAQDWQFAEIILQAMKKTNGS